MARPQTVADGAGVWSDEQDAGAFHSGLSEGRGSSGGDVEGRAAQLILCKRVDECGFVEKRAARQD